jgi:hypothetical protein
VGAFTTEGSDFDEFKSVGLHEKHAVATGNLRNISVFAWGRGKRGKPVGRRNFRLHTDI